MTSCMTLLMMTHVKDVINHDAVSYLISIDVACIVSDYTVDHKKEPTNFCCKFVKNQRI